MKADEFNVVTEESERLMKQLYDQGRKSQTALFYSNCKLMFQSDLLGSEVASPTDSSMNSSMRRLASPAQFRKVRKFNIDELEKDTINSQSPVKLRLSSPVPDQPLDDDLPLNEK